MIIKSTSRKSKSFSQLLSYLLRENEFDTKSWNFYCSKENIKEIVEEFMQNATHIDNSRGSVYMYHDVISLNKNNLSIKEQKEILNDLVNQYIQSRASSNLAFSVTHTDKSHIHAHIVISANKIKENKRTRLSKKQFKDIQMHLEAYKNQKYPQLTKTLFYDKVKNFSKSKRVEQEMKHKRNKLSKKEYVKTTLKEFFRTAQNERVLQSALKEHGFEIYRRGKNVAVKYDKQSFRFSTLGVAKVYDEFIKSKSKTKTQTKTKTKEQQHNMDQEPKHDRSQTSHKEATKDQQTNSRSKASYEHTKDDEFNFTR